VTSLIIHVINGKGATKVIRDVNRQLAACKEEWTKNHYNNNNNNHNDKIIQKIVFTMMKLNVKASYPSGQTT
jgi:hypothetical protein